MMQFFDSLCRIVSRHLNPGFDGFQILPDKICVSLLTAAVATHKAIIRTDDDDDDDNYDTDT